jgi:hypothetical protein
MKTFTNMAAQGDFVIMRVADLPENENFVEIEADATGNIVVAHSETGHNHVMERENVTVYRDSNTSDADLYELFMIVKEPAEIKHLRSYDTHETLLVPPGTYKIRRQREYTAEGFRRAAD